MRLSRRQLLGTAAAAVSPAAAQGAGDRVAAAFSSSPLPDVSTRQELVEALSQSERLATFLSGFRKPLVLERWSAEHPPQEMVYRFTRDRPADDASVIAVGTMGYLAQSFDNHCTPEQFGAKRDGKSDDTRALRAASMLASSRRLRVELSAGAYLVSNTIPLEITPSAFDGAAFDGAGVRNTVILFKPVRVGVPCFQMNGGSGQSTNKRLSGLTIRPYSPEHAGHGIGVQVRGQCLARVEDVEVENLAVGVELVNQRAREFTEFNVFQRLRLLDNKTGVHIHRRGGADSFHGNVFRDIRINVPTEGAGLMIGGRAADGSARSGVCFVYNCHLDFKLFGGPERRFGILIDGANTTGNSGHFTCEGALTNHLEEGNFILDGGISSIHELNWSGSARGNFGFSRASQAGVHAVTPMPKFSDARLAGSQMGFFETLRPDGKVNSIIPTLFPILSKNVGAVGLSVYNGDPRNGFYIGVNGFGSRPEDFAPRWFFQHDGSALEVTSASVDIRQGNEREQLVLSNGRTGGKIGRRVSAVIQPSEAEQVVKLLRISEAAGCSLLHISLRAANVNGVIVAVVSYDPRNSAGYVEEMVARARHGEMPPFALSVGVDGHLQATVQTDEELIVTIAESGIGHQWTN